VKLDDFVDKFCPNKKCPSREMNQLIFFCQKKQMDIEGLGEKQIQNLYEKGFIRNIIDIYDLHKRKTELENLEGLGKKSVKIILDGIENSKKKDFQVLLPSLGFSEIGHKVTELLIENGYDSIDSLLQLVKLKNARDLLLEIHGLGEKTVESIIVQLTDKENQKVISELQKRGLNFSAEKKQKSSNAIFAGQTWCVTGSFENYNPREKAMELVVFYGGKKVSSVSSKTTHLLAGESAGSKLEKAKELGITIVSESEFMELVRKAESSK
jgi:DNA ligase (NAD+)